MLGKEAACKVWHPGTEARPCCCSPLAFKRAAPSAQAHFNKPGPHATRVLTEVCPLLDAPPPPLQPSNPSNVFQSQDAVTLLLDAVADQINVFLAGLKTGSFSDTPAVSAAQQRAARAMLLDGVYTPATPTLAVQTVCRQAKAAAGAKASWGAGGCGVTSARLQAGESGHGIQLVLGACDPHPLTACQRMPASFCLLAGAHQG